MSPSHHLLTQILLLPLSYLAQSSLAATTIQAHITGYGTPIFSFISNHNPEFVQNRMPSLYLFTYSTYATYSSYIAKFYIFWSY